MAKKFIGDLCAYVKDRSTGNTSYPRIGAAFQDDDGRISIKLDCLPIAGSSWNGWCNVFLREKETAEKKPGKKDSPDAQHDDDIPF